MQKCAEHVISILSSLFRNLTDPTARARLVLKFIENDHEKMDRVLEMHKRYCDRLAAADAEIAQRREERAAEREEEGEEFDDADRAAEKEDEYTRRLEGGLYTLQLVSLVVGYCCVEDEGDTVRIVIER